MNRVCMRVATLVWLLAPVANSLASPPPPSSAQARQTAATSTEQWITQANESLLDHDAASAREQFEQAIRSTDFVLLPRTDRYQVLVQTGLLEYQARHAHRTHDLMQRATAFEDAGPEAWGLRLASALNLDDSPDAARSLTVIARRWPTNLHRLFPGLPLHLHRALHKTHHDDVDRAMLDAVFDAHWPRDVDGGDGLWRQLALMHLRRHELSRATRVALRVHCPIQVFSMRVDKRFDPIRRRHPRAFDIQRLIQARIRQARDAVKAHPHQLAAIQRLQKLYLQAGQPDRVLAVSDAAVQLARKGRGAASFTDFGHKYNWILNLRADALAQQGHWNHAARVLKQAAALPEFGQINISQSINLGNLYARMNQPDKAAEAIAQIGGMSAYGRVQLERVKLYIAIDRHDTAAIDRHMAFLRAHRRDAVGAWQTALLLHGDLDQAAALLIERLRRPDWRRDALLDLQDYPDTPNTILGKRISDRLESISKRPDVLAALHKVGRIEQVKYPL